MRAQLLKLNYDANGDGYCKIDRLLDLVSCVNESRVRSILVTLSHSIADFNGRIEQWNTGKEFSVDNFRASVYEVDVMLAALYGLRMLLGLDGAKQAKDSRIGIDDKFILRYFGDDADVIRQFRYLRGLVLAHPFDMWVSKDSADMEYLEDIFVGCPSYLWSEVTDRDADFILDVRKSGAKFSDYRGVYFGRDVVDVAHCIMCGMACLFDSVGVLLDDTIRYLVSVDMCIRHDSLLHRINDLKRVTKVRYPDFVTQYENFMTHEVFERCVLDDIYAALSCRFGGRLGHIYLWYKRRLLSALDKYECDLQNMSFEDGCDYAYNALRSDTSVLHELIDWSQLNYALSKICDYLRFSDSRIDGLRAIQMFELFGYDYCACDDNLDSPAGWAIIHIYILCERFGLTHRIDFSLSNGEIAVQFWAVVHELNLLCR